MVFQKEGKIMSHFNAVKVSERVYWVGAIDNSIVDFHGYSTHRGTTYNAFLIMGKTPILIDTVKKPFYEEMMARIASIIDPTKIEVIISNHAEMDHSGSLPQAIQDIQPKKIYASKMGVQALKAHFHFDDHVITEVNPKEKLTIDDIVLSFVETRMLHWPDSMFTYLHGDGILFSQDGFGMHYACHKLFSDQNDHCIMEHEAKKYFANILMPYANFVKKVFAALPVQNFNIKMIAPDHGPLWNNKNDIEWILSLWKEWAELKASKKVVIIYDTMWNSTAIMASVIADNISKDIQVKVMPLHKFHRSDVATEVLDAGALLVGTPTLNGQMFPTLADVLTYLKGLKPKNLMGQAFGSYGWAPEGVKLAAKELEVLGVNFVGDPIAINYVPDDQALEACALLGKLVSEQL